MEKTKLYWGKTIASFFLVLFTMPLGHALMRVMEETMSVSVMNKCAFLMGFVGLVMAIVGGALMPPLQGSIIDAGGSEHILFGLPSVNVSYGLPLICFLMIIIYGMRSYKKTKKI